jgi:hypothetical protein
MQDGWCPRAQRKRPGGQTAGTSHSRSVTMDTGVLAPYGISRCQPRGWLGVLARPR